MEYKIEQIIESLRQLNNNIIDKWYGITLGRDELCKEIQQIILKLKELQ